MGQLRGRGLSLQEDAEDAPEEEEEKPKITVSSPAPECPG